ncbi:hypothetical protein [Thermodesulfovibrio hydrogeniphilus]
MNELKLKKALLVVKILIIFTISSSCVPYSDQYRYSDNIIINANLNAFPKDYSGNCPTKIRFQGNITVRNILNSPLTVHYLFERSDGVKSSVYSHTFHRDGSFSVSHEWILGRSYYEVINGWMRLEIIEPYSVRSNKAYFKVTCRNEHSPEPYEEDCIFFNPSKTEVKYISGRWKIVEGNKWLFDFGAKRDEAEQALRIIKYYGMNQSCFVGRPKPSFSYLLVSGQPPRGEFPGEDCISFNPDKVSVYKDRGRWKIVEGYRVLFDFDYKEADARKALELIHRYGFKRACYVGRPDYNFMYLRR